MERDISAEIKIENGTLKGGINININLLAELKKLTMKSSNKLDDGAVSILEGMKEKLSWEGLKKKIL